MNKELKHFAKAVCYRILAIIVSIPFIGLKGSIELHFALSLVYYFHEKIWDLSGKNK